MKMHYMAIALSFLIFFSAGLAQANAGLGIAREYLPDNTLLLSAGESEIYSISLQNSGSSDAEVTFEIESSENIVSVINPQKTYVVPAGSSKQIYLRVNVPKNAKIGNIYEVRLYTGSAKAGDDAGQISLKTGAGTSFKVQVISPDEGSTKIARTADFKVPFVIPWHFLVVLAISISAVIGYVYYKKFA